MAFSCGGKAPIICSFCHQEKKKAGVNTGKNDSLAYISLTALNAPPGQNLGNESTKGSS
jgi:hypothetical protein